MLTLARFRWWVALVGLTVAHALAQPVRPLKAEQTILKVEACGPRCAFTVRLNSKIVPPGAIQPGAGLAWTDVSGLVRAGQNLVTVSYTGEVVSSGVTVSHAATPGKFRQLLATRLSSEELAAVRRSRFQRFTVVVPAPGGPVGGSTDRQTLVRGTSSGQPFLVTVNGRRVANVTSREFSLDVSAFVRPGQNELRVIWSEPVEAIRFKIAYAPTRNRFADLASFSASGGLGNSGNRRLRFTVPGP